MPWLRDQSQVFSSGAMETRWLTFTVPTVTSPQLAPQGCSIVEMFPTLDQPIDPDDWSDALKEEIAEKSIDLLRREHAVDINVRRYSGALYGIAPTAGPAALFKHRSPIHGLYLAGQTTWPGFGVVGAGMSGIFAAETLLNHESI